MILALIAHSAWACGGLVTTDHSEQLAASDAQRAILDVGTDDVTVDYEVHYTGNASDFGWIIPIPGEVAEVAEIPTTRFDELSSYTAPTVTWHEPAEEEEAGCGACSKSGLSRSKGDGNSLAGGDTQGDALDVSVLGSGYAGGYDYTILSSDSATALATWLADNGYDLTYAQAPIDAYVADPVGFQWVVVKLVPDVTDTSEAGVSISPLRIRYTEAADGHLHVRFPARMSSTTQTAEVRTEVYVVGESHAAAGTGWEADTAHQAFGALSDDPVEVYADYLRGVGGASQGLAAIFQGSWDDPDSGQTRFVTRYDAIVAPATNTSDMVFTLDGNTESWAFQVELGEYGYGFLPFGVIAALGTAWRLRRRG
jgi:hypothetical protein